MRNAMLGFAAFALAGCQSAPEAPPPAAPEPALGPVSLSPGSAVIDQSVTITPPSKSVPTQYAAFSGIWAGRLEGMYEGKLAVLTVSPKGKVTVTYAWGDLGDNRPGVADGDGKIVGNTLKLGRLPNGADATFIMLPDGSLTGTYTLAGQTYKGAFVRQ
jgi:hypothetical protein